MIFEGSDGGLFSVTCFSRIYLVAVFFDPEDGGDMLLFLIIG
jgi:hypothetical protein